MSTRPEMDALDQQNREGSERTEWVVEVKPGDYQSHNKKRHSGFDMTDLAVVEERPARHPRHLRHLRPPTPVVEIANDRLDELVSDLRRIGNFGLHRDGPGGVVRSPHVDPSPMSQIGLHGSAGR